MVAVEKLHIIEDSTVVFDRGLMLAKAMPVVMLEINVTLAV